MDHFLEKTYRNIRLRPLGKEDIESLRKWRNNPDNTGYLRKIPYITSSMQQEWFEHYLQDKEEMIFAIVETDRLNRLVGSLSLYDIHENECTFGKILIGDPYAHGQKIGANATIAAITIAFDDLNKDIVNLYVYEENQKAIRVYKEAGFRVADIHKDKADRTEYTMIVNKGEWNHE